MKNLQEIKVRFVRRFCSGLDRLERISQRMRLNLEDCVQSPPEEDRKVLARNRELRNRHRGEPCFVIGNGPSLNQQDLRPLGSWITFAMSGFWKHPIVEEWQPTYFCFADPVFFDGSEPMRSFFTEMSKRVSCTTYLIPLEGQSVAREQSLFKGGPVYYVNFQGSLDRTFAKRVDFESVVPRVQSVSQLAIMSAIYLGCSPIYLIGLDHDWLAKRGHESHFYAGRTIEGHPVAHGDLGRVPYRDDLVSVLNLWDGYKRLKTIAANEGCEIINASDGGFLDVFPRARYEHVLDLHHSNYNGPGS
jgi:hypothetical protein